MTEADLPLARSIVELMVLIAWSDGRVEGNEALSIHKQVTTHPLLKQVGGTSELSRKARERMNQLGLEEAIRQVAASIQGKPQRELAFQCCAKVMGSDGDFGGEEAMVLGTLQEVFELSSDDVRRLLVLATG
jgi:hypothetical protein